MEDLFAIVDGERSYFLSSDAGIDDEEFDILCRRALREIGPNATPGDLAAWLTALNFKPARGTIEYEITPERFVEAHTYAVEDDERLDEIKDRLLSPPLS